MFVCTVWIIARIILLAFLRLSCTVMMEGDGEVRPRQALFVFMYVKVSVCTVWTQ